MAQGANTINRHWADSDRLIPIFESHGIVTPEQAEQATDAEWDMAASLAGGMPSPDRAFRRFVVGRMKSLAAMPEDPFEGIGF